MPPPIEGQHRKHYPGDPAFNEAEFKPKEKAFWVKHAAVHDMGVIRDILRAGRYLTMARDNDLSPAKLAGERHGLDEDEVLNAAKALASSRSKKKKQKKAIE